jgi:hypothetical protein
MSEIRVDVEVLDEFVQVVNVAEGPPSLSEAVVDLKITNAIDQLKAGAPEVYDTLLEVANKLQGNDDVVAALTQLISAKTTIHTVDLFGLPVGMDEEGGYIPGVPPEEATHVTVDMQNFAPISVGMRVVFVDGMLLQMMGILSPLSHIYERMEEESEFVNAPLEELPIKPGDGFCLPLTQLATGNPPVSLGGTFASIANVPDYLANQAGLPLDLPIIVSPTQLIFAAASGLMAPLADRVTNLENASSPGGGGGADPFRPSEIDTGSLFRTFELIRQGGAPAMIFEPTFTRDGLWVGDFSWQFPDLANYTFQTSIDVRADFIFFPPPEIVLENFQATHKYMEVWTQEGNPGQYIGGDLMEAAVLWADGSEAINGVPYKDVPLSFWEHAPFGAEGEVSKYAYVGWRAGERIQHRWLTTLSNGVMKFLDKATWPYDEQSFDGSLEERWVRRHMETVPEFTTIDPGTGVPPKAGIRFVGVMYGLQVWDGATKLVHIDEDVLGAAIGQQSFVDLMGNDVFTTHGSIGMYGGIS